MTSATPYLEEKSCLDLSWESADNPCVYIIPERRRRTRLPFLLIWTLACVLLSGVLVVGQGTLDGWWIDQALAVDGDVGPGPLPSPPGDPAPVPNPDPRPADPPPPPPPSSAAESFPPVPAGSGEGRRVVYGNSHQRIWLVEPDGSVYSSWLVSGRKGLPRTGTYRVASKSRFSSAQRGRLRFEYMVRYAKGRRLWMGFHSIPVGRRGPIQSEARLGTFTSTGGCVRQRLSDARILYEWAPLGTKVVVTH